MMEANEGTKPTNSANSNQESEIIRKPVVSNPHQFEPDPEGDRSPIRQERDALETEQSSHPTEKTPEATEVVRKPVLDPQTEPEAE